LTLRVVLLPQRGVDSPVTARRSQFHPPNPFLTMNKVEAEQHYQNGSKWFSRYVLSAECWVLSAGC
jgi:hypothetical protein